MPAKKPQRRVPAQDEAASPTLMGNQDTKNKGDSGAVKKDKLMSFWVTPGQYEEIKGYAQAHRMSMSRLIIEGLEMRMRQE